MVESGNSQFVWHIAAQIVLCGCFGVMQDTAALVCASNTMFPPDGLFTDHLNYVFSYVCDPYVLSVSSTHFHQFPLKPILYDDSVQLFEYISSIVFFFLTLPLDDIEKCVNRFVFTTSKW